MVSRGRMRVLPYCKGNTFYEDLYLRLRSRLPPPLLRVVSTKNQSLDFIIPHSTIYTVAISFFFKCILVARRRSRTIRSRQALKPLPLPEPFRKITSSSSILDTSYYTKIIEVLLQNSKCQVKSSSGFK